ncbi:MAG: hypothetical protein ACM32O_17000 [Clostridia bacterium]
MHFDRTVVVEENGENAPGHWATCMGVALVASIPKAEHAAKTCGFEDD